jgi:hypothetical protein
MSNHKESMMERVYIFADRFLEGFGAEVALRGAL